MRVLFAATPELGLEPLDRLARTHTVCAVLTAQERPSGRGRITRPSPVKLKALELGLLVLQPEKIDLEFRERVASLSPELLVVVAYGKIFRKSFIELFPRGGVNLHPSLLPKYRGPSPIQACILAGDGEFGVTVQRLAKEVDAGAILAQETMPLAGNETALDLLRKASSIGTRLLERTVAEIETGLVIGIPQKHEEASYCSLVRKEDGRIRWDSEAAVIERMVRAYQPWPRAFTTFKGQNLYLLKAGAGPPDQQVAKCLSDPGVVTGVSEHFGLTVSTGRGVLYIETLQLQSKKATDWRSFYNGHRDILGYRLGGNICAI